MLAALRGARCTPYALSPGQLATQTMVTSGTMTNRVDRLEARAGSGCRVSPDPQPTGAGFAWHSTDAGIAWPIDGAFTDLLSSASTLLLGSRRRDAERRRTHGLMLLRRPDGAIQAVGVTTPRTPERRSTVARFTVRHMHPWPS